MIPPKHRVLVLGAGVCGLSSAVRIQESRDDVDVTICAEKFSPETTSDGSAGFLMAICVGNTDAALLEELSRETYQEMMDLSLSPLAGELKILQISGAILRDTVIEKELEFKDFVTGYRRLSQEEIDRIPGAKDGRFFTTLAMDVPAYLAWLTKRFLSNGGTLRQRKVESLKELSSDWDVVVNCVGLGSHQLFGDDKMKPVRGQVFRVSAPWIKHFYLMESKGPNGYQVTHALPNTDAVVVGGTFQEGDWNTEINEDDSKQIWSNVTHMLGSLKNAKVLSQWAGLRPGRETLRLESETVTGKDFRKLHVVHNYGHGGAGITLHWGCARKVTEMVDDCLGHVGGSRKVKVAPSSKL